MRIWDLAVERSTIRVDDEAAKPTPYPMRHTHAPTLPSAGTGESVQTTAPTVGAFPEQLPRIPCVQGDPSSWTLLGSNQRPLPREGSWRPFRALETPGRFGYRPCASRISESHRFASGLSSSQRHVDAMWSRDPAASPKGRGTQPRYTPRTESGRQGTVGRNTRSSPSDP